MPLRSAKPRRRQISQKLIASEAGVSQSTVSLVLSGRSVSSDSTRRRVLEAAQRLRYRPNLLVHAMQTGKTRMIGVMAPPFDFYWSEILYGIHDALVAADNVPITLWAWHQGPGPRDRTQPGGHVLAQIHRLIDRRVDGVILWPPFATLYQDHIQEFSSRDLPVVTIDHELPAAFGADFVGSDEAMGGRLVAAHLYHQGHRRIGHLAGPAVATWAVARRRAFEEALRQFDDAHCLTIEAPPGETTFGNEPARRLLTSPQRPTAIYAASDLYAKEVYRAARELGLRVPQDVSVVGFSDDDFAVEMEPPLTTVRQPAYAIGRKAAELVLTRAAQRRQAVQVRLGVELTVRRSTAPPAASLAPGWVSAGAAAFTGAGSLAPS